MIVPPDGPVFDEGFEFNFALSCAKPHNCEGTARLLLHPEEYVDAVCSKALLAPMVPPLQIHA